MRINKYLASAGLGARRKCEELVTSGRVTINGKKILDLGTQIGDGDIVTVDGKRITRDDNFVYIMLNKPKGYITSAADQRGRKTVFDLVKTDKLIHAVGRLDYETEGLLLLTNDGEWTQKLIHPRSGVEKTYAVTIDKPITNTHFTKLETGIVIDGELTHPARAQANLSGCSVTLQITQGRNRQVRRMFAALGYEVVNLKRTAIGKLELGNLQLGTWKFLDETELSEI